MRKRLLLMAAAIALGLAIGHDVVRTQDRQTLDIYFIDVEGGQATLFVSPAGESFLVDAGNPGDRDADRIATVARQAGVTRIDNLMVTHYDGDHHGGAKDLSARLPIQTFIDHGPRVIDPAQKITPQFQAYVERTDQAYAEAREKGQHLVVEPGDKIPFPGVDIQVVAGSRAAIKNPLPGAGSENALCNDYKPQENDPSENSFSLGVVMAYGRFRMLDLGDLTWNREHDLVCPRNLLGAVDVYLTTHHGLNLSGPPALVHAVRPRVAIMNNAARKGGSRETWTTIKSSPGLEDIWQLHYSVPREGNPSFHEAQPTGGTDLNAPQQFIANLDEAPTHERVHFLKISARPDGSFAVTNSRNAFTKEYPPLIQNADVPLPLPLPRYHHIHINSINPDRSLDWYAKYWPAGRRTSLNGFPAFQAGDLYLLYSKVDQHAPGAYDRKLYRSVPQSAFWTFGSGVVDTAGLVARLTKLDPKAFEFLPVFAGPDDKTGVIRSSLAPQGDQLLTVTQLRDRVARDRRAPGAPRPGNQDFGYLVDPDGMLVEFNSASEDHFWAHNHFWHEKPLCAANWYVEHLGMQLSPRRDDKTGQMVLQARWDPCDVPIGEVGYPSFMPQGQLRIPIFNVRFANGSWAAYTRQCRAGRCGTGNDRPLVPTRGQVVDHMAFIYPDLGPVLEHLRATRVPIVEGPYKFGDSRAILIEDPDGLALELIEGGK